ncbi:meiotically up-regulated protein 113 family protein [Clostridioides difficile 824]|uniref:DUF4041 domain-containing protein n=14 Tax=Clostridioides difficile TaxID=1496 RepID=A0A9P4DB33_CLODI|nr:DUF4041 domain-containing protein [Clostridioides difficile]OFU44025.1 hypothetical protein HMPREF3071_11620 [Clostridium sp. HMSC19A11]EGT4563485.1 DUF4041 domain-containing protein [Clostridioides difficile]EGT4660195.1 DUF4041 domain-containing protein [Clostridioides difficile]EGT4721668.1 DUF4041 domain-containing protein [Clostridioides difficile]EGT4849763.1 DUF4041 domain-containing protein [Clostridioides difficile]
MNNENEQLKSDLLINDEKIKNLNFKIPWYYSLWTISILILSTFSTYSISFIVAIIFLFKRNKIMKKHKDSISILLSDVEKINNKYILLNDEIKMKEKHFEDLCESNENKLKELSNLLDKKKVEIDKFDSENQDKFKLIEELKIEKERLDNLIKDKNILKDNINTLNAHLEELKDEREELRDINTTLKNKKEELKRLSEELIQTEDEVLLQSFGLYNPKYDFENSDEYMEKLKEIRERQKLLIRNKTGVKYSDSWTVDGSIQKGRTMTNQNIKTALKLFNSECDIAMSKVSFKNIDSIEKRIRKAFTDTNKLNTSNKVSIKENYLNLKIDELYLYYEYLQMKEEEKEEQRALREQMKEEALVQKEIENQKRKLKKEELQFKNELLRLKSTIPEDENDKLEWEQKINSIEEKLALLSKDLDDVLNREQNTRAGHVYIISNIGSFGENIYKIGVTRRLDPTERINELSSASVPFKYDIHATIFSEDAPKLESALHKAFDNKRVNKVNNRKEFFKVTLDEIRTEVEKNFDKTVEYTKLAEAQEYRQTLKIQELNKKLA